MLSVRFSELLVRAVLVQDEAIDFALAIPQERELRVHDPVGEPVSAYREYREKLLSCEHGHQLVIFDLDGELRVWCDFVGADVFVQDGVIELDWHQELVQLVVFIE